jgi:hypothetical protein
MPGAVHWQITCTAPGGCSHPPGEIHQNADYTMDLIGDRVDACHVIGDDLTVRLANRNQPGDTLMVRIHPYPGHGGTYPLDLSLERYITISTSEDMPNCPSGVPAGTSAGTPQAGSPDTCGASGCSVIVDDAPGRAFPHHIRFQLSCPNLCPNGTTYTCTKTGGGPLTLDINPSCEDHN